MTDTGKISRQPDGPAVGGSAVGRTLRALIRRSGVVRSAVKSAAVQRPVMTWRALTVVRRVRFLARQMLG
jgi:hypothetical protein